MSPYIQAIADDFRTRSSINKDQPPYDIAGAVSLLMPLDIISLSELSVNRIKEWLNSKGISISMDVHDRILHGFVMISRGVGFMFVNGTDTEAERRYTIAHEVGHFILDYQIPREKTIKKLGSAVQDVLDGVRSPTDSEQIDGLLKGVSVRPYTHLLEKNGDGSFESLQIFQAENRADKLALELLAPNIEVIKATISKREKLSFAEFDRSCLELLVSKYQLPETIAVQYAKQLAYSVVGRPSIVNKLGF